MIKGPLIQGHDATCSLATSCQSALSFLSITRNTTRYVMIAIQFQMVRPGDSVPPT